MFVQKTQHLPQDPEYPQDLKELGCAYNQVPIRWLNANEPSSAILSHLLG